HVHRGQLDLIRNQDPWHPFAGDARALRKLGQVNDVERPRRTEEELHDRDVDGESVHRIYSFGLKSSSRNCCTTPKSWSRFFSIMRKCVPSPISTKRLYGARVSFAR